MKIAVVCVLWAIVNNCQATRRRHVIYWNSAMTPELKVQEHVQHVEIGEFMDILCPQHSLMEIVGGPREPAVFDLYNVTKSEYDHCQLRGRHRFLFACNRPERENKLTIKFQTISPSPLGFKFQYCADYYFMALPRGHRSRFEGCSEDNTRLHIKVACKEVKTTPAVPTTTFSTTATSPTTTTVLSRVTTEKPSTLSVREFLKRLQQNQKKIKDEKLFSQYDGGELFIEPEMMHPPVSVEAGMSKDNPRSMPTINNQKGGAENAVERNRPSLFVACLCIALSLFCVDIRFS